MKPPRSVCGSCGRTGKVGLTSSGPRCIGCFMYGDKRKARKGERRVR